MPKNKLLSAWMDVRDWIAFNLMKDGYEAVVFKPLGEYPQAAAFLAKETFQSDQFEYRKIAATLVGYIQKADTNLLWTMFQHESDRNSSLATNIRRFQCQSVVEDIVLSAALLCRKQSIRPGSLSLLRHIIEETMNGTYWNTSSYAMVTVYRYTHDEVLLERFSRFAESNNDYTQEQTYARGIKSNDPKILSSIESLFDEKLAIATTARLDEEAKAMIDRLLMSAATYSPE